MKTDNRGFTLTELIVSIAIFAIVAAAAYGFMVAGATSYSSVSGALSRQLRAQMVFGQIENRLVDCDTAIYPTSDSKLYIVNKSDMDAAKYDVYVYELRDGTLYYGKHENQTLTLADKKLTAASVSKLNLNAADVLSQKVASFSVAVPESSKPVTDSGTRVRSAEVKLQLQVEKGTAAAETQTAALRNAPLLLS